MAEQFELPGFEPAPPRPPAVKAKRPRGPRLPHSLFFALLPPPDDALRIAQSAQTLRAQHGLTGTLLRPDRLHVSLQDLGGSVDEPPPAVIDAARLAAAGVPLVPVRVIFDRVLGFAGSGAVVLRSAQADTVAALSALTQALGLALAEAGLRPRPSHTPHMTLLYDDQPLAEQAIDPLCWTAAYLVLVHSLVGKTEHRVLGRWPLPA